jgi:hypothetical protein
VEFSGCFRWFCGCLVMGGRKKVIEIEGESHWGLRRVGHFQDSDRGTTLKSLEDATNKTPLEDLRDSNFFFLKFLRPLCQVLKDYRTTNHDQGWVSSTSSAFFDQMNDNTAEPTTRLSTSSMRNKGETKWYPSEK